MPGRKCIYIYIYQGGSDHQDFLPHSILLLQTGNEISSKVQHHLVGFCKLLLTGCKFWLNLPQFCFNYNPKSWPCFKGALQEQGWALSVPPWSALMQPHKGWRIYASGSRPDQIWKAPLKSAFNSAFPVNLLKFQVNQNWCKNLFLYPPVNPH